MKSSYGNLSTLLCTLTAIYWRYVKIWSSFHLAKLLCFAVAHQYVVVAAIMTPSRRQRHLWRLLFSVRFLALSMICCCYISSGFSHHSAELGRYQTMQCRTSSIHWLSVQTAAALTSSKLHCKPFNCKRCRFQLSLFSYLGHRVLRAVLTFKISNTKKDSGFDVRIYVQIIWVFKIASKFPYLNRKKTIFEKIM